MTELSNPIQPERNETAANTLDSSDQPYKEIQKMENAPSVSEVLQPQIASVREISRFPKRTEIHIPTKDTIAIRYEHDTKLEKIISVTQSQIYPQMEKVFQQVVTPDGKIQVVNVNSNNSFIKRIINMFPESVSFLRVSDMHQRSVVIGDFRKGQPLFSIGDKWYGALVMKGADFENPHLDYDNNFNPPIRTNGLVASDVAIGLCRTSEVFAAAGVPGERVVKIIKPTEIPYHGRLVSQKEFKKLLLNNLAIRIKHYKDNCQYDNPYVTDIDLQAVEHYLDRIDYVIPIRAATVPDRIGDLRLSKTRPDLLRLMARTFAFVNANEMKKHGQDPSYNVSQFILQISGQDGKEALIDRKHNNEIIQQYLYHYLPTKIGESLALMHREGIVHGGLPVGNWGLDGSVYDLDTPRGVGIDDQPVPDTYLITELKKTILPGRFSQSMADASETPKSIT